ncbi:MAG: PD-(D/E)XK nuclease family protein [Oscillospiraceae bacterium]
MLNLITGANHTNKDKIFIDLIKQQAEAGKDILIIIPDQFSLEYDKKLYSALGAQLFNKIKAMGFNRLAELTAKEFGSNSTENADKNAVIICMYKAIRAFRKSGNVKFYEKSLQKSSFISELIAIIDDFSRSGLTYQDLEISAANAEGSLALKLYDISQIYKLFNQELDNAGLKMPVTAVEECAKTAEEKGYFIRKEIFIDAFADFSADEYKLIRCMLRQADNVTAMLTISHENLAKTNQSPFSQTIRTANSLKHTASELGIEINETEIYHKNSDTCSTEIAHIDENLYCTRCEKLPQSKKIHLLSANEPYEETEYVAAEICRLVREENYRYKDIAVLAGNLGDISSIIEGTFQRYELPYFIDMKRNAAQSAPIIYINSIFECVLTKKWNTEKILKYIKSPFSDFMDYDIYDLESYCITWNVNGDMWLSDFTAATGNSSSLQRINETRRRIIKPLAEFKNASADGTAKDICKAFYTLLDKIGISEQIFSKIKLAASMNETEKLQQSRELKQLWTAILSAVSAIYTNMGDEKISLREFYGIFKLMISQISVSQPPQKADCIRIAATNHSRLSDIKAAFVIQTCDKIFPAPIHRNGLLSIKDIKSINEMGIDFSQSPKNQLANERFNVYNTLTLPSDKLYVSYSESDSKGNLQNCSAIFPMMNRMFDLPVEKIQDMDIEFFCCSYRTALYKYLEKQNDRNANISSVRQSIKTSQEYSDKLDSILENAKQTEHHLTESNAKAIILPHDLNMSPTRINDYYSCPFMYFCKYGLKLKTPNSIKIDQLSTGNLIHNCFENILSTETNGKRVYNNNFTSFSDDDIHKLIDECFEKYINENLGGDFGKDATFHENLLQVKDKAFYAIKNIQEELENCLFVPTAFEYNLTKNNGESILRIKVDDDISINIRGSIDRADIYTNENGDKFVRIIDYKTGSTTLSLEDLYNGLNLQMLVYLLAITQNINEINTDGKLKPAGILYSHIGLPDAYLTPAEIETLKQNQTLDEKIKIKRASIMKPDGMIIDNEFTLNALNQNLDLVFTPLKKRGKNNALVTESYFYGIQMFAMKKINEMALSLKGGNIPADPIQSTKRLTCSYCDFWSICGNSSPKNPKISSKQDIDKLNSEIEQLINENK